MGKRKKKQHSLMREWPDDEGECVNYSDLVGPLKKIIFEGYKLERYPIKQFTYRGYNIGRSDRFMFATPEERFSPRFLENAEKFKRTLLDNVLETVFLLGMEQGRRADRENRQTNSILEDIIKARTKTIHKLRDELTAYDDTYAIDILPVETEDTNLLIENFAEPLNDVDV